MMVVASKVPYCGLCMSVEDAHTGLWTLGQPPVGPLTHTENISFDWHILHQ